MSSAGTACGDVTASHADRKSTRLNSSHSQISYAVFCLKKKKLLHVRFHDRLAPAIASTVLQGYLGRYAVLLDTVTETEPSFHKDLLSQIPFIDLLSHPF